jgi:hypothetical protein
MRFVAILIRVGRPTNGNGILLKLVDGPESYDVGGPAFPSSSFDDPSVRPRLEVTYVS